LLSRLSGVRKMKRVPDLIFIFDVGREVAAVREAIVLNIPIVAMVDTNCNPQDVDYVIPSNDDAIRAIKLLVAKIADAVLEGKAMRKEEDQTGEAAAEPDVKVEAPSRSRKGPKVVESDDTAQEDVLLGESTLAKLSAARKPDEIVVEEKPVEAIIDDEILADSADPSSEVADA
jgi:small subunit ribosomal protein S2